jgi:hypothetical protein
MDRWLKAAGLDPIGLCALPPTKADGLTVHIWSAARPAAPEQRSVA